MASNTRTNDSNEAFNAYMREARKVALLTPEQEIELATCIKQGGSKGKRAQDALVKANLRLVVSIAWKYVRPNVPLEDLVQEGNLGLIKAVDKFDPALGYRFATYAQWWVRQAVTEYLRENNLAVRIPANRVIQITKMNQAIAAIRRDGSVPTDTAVAAAMNVPVKLVIELAQYAAEPISLNTPIFDGDAEFGDRIEDKGALSPEQSVIGNDLVAKVAGSLDKLETRERDIVTRRYGLDGDEPETLDQLGTKYGVSRERIRQIEAAALKKLAAGQSGKMLKTLL